MNINYVIYDDLPQCASGSVHYWKLKLDCTIQPQKVLLFKCRPEETMVHGSNLTFSCTMGRLEYKQINSSWCRCFVFRTRINLVLFLFFRFLLELLYYYSGFPSPTTTESSSWKWKQKDGDTFRPSSMALVEMLFRFQYVVDRPLKLTSKPISGANY